MKFLIVYTLVGLSLALGSLVPSPVPKLTQQQAQDLIRGGVLEKGDQKVMRRFTSGGGVDSRMPSLFGADEAEYSRFSACLAATEGLRRMRDQSLLERPSSPPGAPNLAALEEEKKIATQYQANSGRVLRAMGMSIDRFNELGREISRDERLKEKVMEQAYLYRMAAMVNLDQIPLMSNDSANDNSGFHKDKVQLFCQSIQDIERLRSSQVDRLKKALHVDDFPASISISDPTLMPFLNPKVRAVVRAFPLQAEDVVKKNGLDSTEFNNMLQEVRSNPIFRWKVQKYLKQEGIDGVEVLEMGKR